MVGKFCQMSNAWALGKKLNGIRYSMGEGSEVTSDTKVYYRKAQVQLDMVAKAAVI